MTDTVNRATRSRIMARIRSKNTKPERCLRAAFAARRIRGWRMWARDLPGTPDFAFDAAKVALFVDSPFWHGLTSARPSAAWAAKFARNRARDASARAALRAAGWTVIRVLENEARHLPGIVAKSLKAAVLDRRT